MDELRTDRLWLRRARPDDLDAMHALVSDWEVVKQTATWPWPPDRAFTETRAKPMPVMDGMAGPVFHGDEMVGMMGLSRKDAGAELGYMFARAHWGRGYAGEIGRALLDAGFAHYDWPEVSACVFDGNPGSVRVLEKLGFVATGRCEGTCKARGTRLPTQTFRLLRP